MCDLGLIEDLFCIAVSSSSAGIALAKLDEELKFVKLAGILLLWNQPNFVGEIHFMGSIRKHINLS